MRADIASLERGRATVSVVPVEPVLDVPVPLVEVPKERDARFDVFEAKLKAIELRNAQLTKTLESGSKRRKEKRDAKRRKRLADVLTDSGPEDMPEVSMH